MLKFNRKIVMIRLYCCIIFTISDNPIYVHLLEGYDKVSCTTENPSMTAIKGHDHGTVRSNALIPYGWY